MPFSLEPRLHAARREVPMAVLLGGLLFVYARLAARVPAPERGGRRSRQAWPLTQSARRSHASAQDTMALRAQSATSRHRILQSSPRRRSRAAWRSVELQCRLHLGATTAVVPRFSREQQGRSALLAFLRATQTPLRRTDPQHPHDPARSNRDLRTCSSTGVTSTPKGLTGNIRRRSSTTSCWIVPGTAACTASIPNSRGTFPSCCSACHRRGHQAARAWTKKKQFVRSFRDPRQLVQRARPSRSGTNAVDEERDIFRHHRQPAHGRRGRRTRAALRVRGVRSAAKRACSSALDRVRRPPRSPASPLLPASRSRTAWRARFSVSCARI